MTLNMGRAYESDFITKLTNHLTAVPFGGTTPYWEKVNSGTFLSEGVILKSVGSSGNENIFVQIKKGSNNYVHMQLLHDYIPNQVSGIDGTFTSATPLQPIHWYHTTYSSNYTFDYWVSFDRDRIMLFLGADKLVENNPTWGSFTWIGLPNRLSAESDSTAACIATSHFARELTDLYSINNYGDYNRCKSIRSRTKAWNPLTTMHSTYPFKSVGWGGQVFLPSIFLDTGDSIRAIMHGIHPLVQVTNAEDFKHGDEITVGSKRYTIFKIRHHAIYYDSSCFGTAWMAVEQLK